MPTTGKAWVPLAEAGVPGGNAAVPGTDAVARNGGGRFRGDALRGAWAMGAADSGKEAADTGEGDA
ncbi:MAG: hypothetical protein WA129_10270 [Acidovorax sp.]